MCDNIHNAIHNHINADSSNEIEPFDFFDQAIKDYLENIQLGGCLIYIETDYFGGTGTQVSAIFKDGKMLETYKGSTTDIDVTLPYPNRLLESPVNKALRYIGIY